METLLKIAFPLFILGTVFFMFTVVMPKRIYSISRKDFKPIIDDIVTRGKYLMGKDCGGRIGLMRFGVGLMSVKVYDTGIILSPALVGKSCILKEEIKSIEDWSMGLVKGTLIIHNSPRINDDVILFTVIPEKHRNILLDKQAEA